MSEREARLRKAILDAAWDESGIGSKWHIKHMLERAAELDRLSNSFYRAVLGHWKVPEKPRWQTAWN